jgi:hypothetical protein
MVIPTGFEPVTYCLEGSCSIQLSYETKMLHKTKKANPEFWTGLFWSGWQDSNLRPPAPKAGAIPGYATPRDFKLHVAETRSQFLGVIQSRRGGDSNPRYRFPSTTV